MSEEKKTERTKLETWLKKNTDSIGFKELTDLVNLGDKKQLEVKMLELAKTIQGVNNTEAKDAKLKQLSDQVKAGKALYKEQRAGAEKRTRLIALAISERFGDVLMDPKED